MLVDLKSPPSTSTQPLRAALLAGAPIEERVMRLAGISTAVLQAGDGPPMVILHGPGEHAPKWREVMLALAPRHRMIVPDLPGHGATEVGEPPDAGRVLDWLAELIRTSGDGKPALVGHVLGGAIAARFAARDTSALRALVLVDSLGLQPFQPAPPFGQALMGYLSDPNEATYEGLWERCAYDLASLKKRLGAEWHALKAYNLERAHAPGLAQVQQRLMQDFGFGPIPPETLGAIRVPTRLIWGRHDLATPLAAAEAASARYGWPLTIIEEAADDPAFDEPQAFLRALEAALPS